MFESFFGLLFADEDESVSQAAVPLPQAQPSPYQSTYIRGQPREVLIKQDVVTPTWQPYPAARKENGGLRGSKATRWRR